MNTVLLVVALFSTIVLLKMINQSTSGCGCGCGKKKMA